MKRIYLPPSIVAEGRRHHRLIVTAAFILLETAAVVFPEAASFGRIGGLVVNLYWIWEV